MSLYKQYTETLIEAGEYIPGYNSEFQQSDLLENSFSQPIEVNDYTGELKFKPNKIVMYLMANAHDAFSKAFTLANDADKKQFMQLSGCSVKDFMGMSGGHANDFVKGRIEYHHEFESDYYRVKPATDEWDILDRSTSSVVSSINNIVPIELPFILQRVRNARGRYTVLLDEQHGVPVPIVNWTDHAFLGGCIYNLADEEDLPEFNLGTITLTIRREGIYINTIGEDDESCFISIDWDEFINELTDDNLLEQFNVPITKLLNCSFVTSNECEPNALLSIWQQTFKFLRNRSKLIEVSNTAKNINETLRSHIQDVIKCIGSFKPAVEQYGDFNLTKPLDRHIYRLLHSIWESDVKLNDGNVTIELDGYIYRHSIKDLCKLERDYKLCSL